MYTRHLEVPILDAYPTRVEAAVYNRVRLALHRAGGQSLRAPVPGLKHLDVIVQPEAWIVVDRAFGDVPVAAWTAFEDTGRDALHTDVSCRLQTHNQYAGMVLKAVKVFLQEGFTDDPDVDDNDHAVLPFPGNNTSGAP